VSSAAHSRREALRRAALGAGVRRMILVSSTIVSAPRRRHPLLRDSPLARLDAYRSARRAAEANAVSTADRLPVAIVRPKTFVGPGRVGGFALIMDAVRRGASVPLIDGGRTSYQLLDVRDLAVALVLVTAADVTGVFELGAHRFGTMAEDVGALITHAGTGARIRPLPRRLALAGLRTTELVGGTPLAEWHQCAARREASIVATDRAERLLGWQARWSNADALIAAYDWHAARTAAGEDPPATHAVPALHRLVGRFAGARPGRAGRSGGR
jgi:nucleoside-diphosphate-sugar epimerase